MVALVAGILPCVPGFLATIGMNTSVSLWTELYHYAWFISFGISFVVYLAITPTHQNPPAILTPSASQGIHP